ncbi:MAG: SAM-dependent methyltransferase [Tissierellia bacterium]|nr:SAM-dependent methyltransferase [Tissierellia bacterium]
MKRLETIVSMVEKCNLVADIGTDHGYVAEMLLKKGICKKVIATDLREGPLNRALEHLTKVNLLDRCELRLGSGLTVLNEGEVDAIIIAGMGGDLISGILEESKNIALKSQLILQPMTAVGNLRKYLIKNGFKIVTEKIVKENHFYFIIKAEKGISKEEDEFYYQVGRILVEKKDQTMVEYLKKVLDTNEKIIRKLEKTGNISYTKKIERLEKKNKRIKELIK